MLRRVFVSICVLGLVFSAASFAATTGRMAGEVRDNDGLALPGVTVSISSDKLIGGAQMAVTGGNGEFVFNLLPVGLYNVEANLPGFQAAAAEVRVSLDRVASITFNMVPESFGSEIEVTAEVPIVDTAQVNSQMSFDQEFLQNAAIGSGGRDYLQVISQAAGVAGSGNASVMGSTGSDNSYLIDGMNTTDPSLGTFGTNFNYDAIQEISFQTGGFEAEFGQATGGIINLVTKSGGNQFSGSLDIRYRGDSMIESGDHYDPDEQVSSTQNISATLGGPILRDKLWFFLSVENIDNSFQSEGAPVPWNFKGWNYIAKATWQINDSNRMVFKYAGDPAEIPGRNSSQFVAADGSLTTTQGGDSYQAELNSVLSETVLMNVSLGRHDLFTEGYPYDEDSNRSGHWNEDSGITYRYPWTWDLPRGRDQLDLAFTWFVDDLAGNHEFKFGGQYTDIYEEDSTFLTGGGDLNDVDEPPVREFDDINGDGFFNHYIRIKEPEDTVTEYLNSTGTTTTFFAQDAWRPTANLTIKPGVRFDNVTTTNHVGEQIADMDQWQPRVGFAWDIAGNAKHVFRGSWGQFMDPTALSIAGFARGVPTVYHEYNTLEYYCNAVGICNRNILEAIYGPALDWTNWEGITYTLFDNRGITAYEPAQTLDQAGFGSLKAPYAESLILAYETQIMAESSIEVTYVDKETHEMIEDTCANNTWAWGDGELPSLDDSTTWTTAGDCDRYIVANVPGFGRQYTAFILKFETRMENLHLQASITRSDSEGNTYNGASDTYATELADFYPLHFFNRQGFLPDHREVRVKASGYWLLPYDFTIGFDGFWSDAGHISPSTLCSNYTTAPPAVHEFYGYDDSLSIYCSTPDGLDLSNSTDDLYLEPRGSYETKSVWDLDMQFSKAFHVGSVDISAILAIYNIVGREQDSTFNSTAYRTTANEDLGEPVYTESGELINYYIPIGQPLTYRQPRRYEIGFRIEF